jgi:hypothetical protein
MVFPSWSAVVCGVGFSPGLTESQSLIGEFCAFIRESKVNSGKPKAVPLIALELHLDIRRICAIPSPGQWR